MLSARKRRANTRASKDLRIDMVAVRVTLLLDTFTIEGSIYVAPEMRRFSDAWEVLMRDPRSSIPVTDALIKRIGDGETFACRHSCRSRNPTSEPSFP